MEEGRYGEAIRFLKKDFDPKNPDAASGILLATCYYQTHEYENARDIMDLVGIQQLEKDLDQIRLYADILIANDDFSGAHLMLLQSLVENETDVQTWLWLNKTSDLLAWDSIATGSKIFEITGANSIYNEYAPYAAPKGELWFVSDVISVQAVFPAAYNDQNIHLLFKTKPKDENRNTFEKPSMLVKNRRYYFHDGPMNNWPGQNKYAITLRDLEGPVSGARIGIFFTTLDGKEEDMIPFRFNEKYNTGHPTFSADGNRMYFASDRPGGYGQMDIWYCDWENGNWSVPINMGPFVNTPSNEVFVHYNEGRLYFSSDRRDMGYGGLDIYYANEFLGFDEVYNLRQPINSAYDDFSVSFENYSRGYFASNRPEGAGGDDLYGLEFYTQQLGHELILARIINDNLAPGTLVSISDSKGEIVAETNINQNGEIALRGLKSREKYTLRVLEQRVLEDAKLGILNNRGFVTKSFDKTGPAAFEFELLDPGYYQLVKDDQDDLSVLRFDLKGKVVTDEETDFTSASVSVKDQFGTTVGNVKPSLTGEFEFKGLRSDEKYRLETNGIDVPHEMDIFGTSGAVVQSIKPMGDNSFAYTRTSPAAAWMQAAEIVVPQVFAIQVGSEIPDDTKLSLYDGDDKFLYTCDMNEDGFIALGNLTAGKAYRLNLDAFDILKTDRLMILDGSGDTSQTVRPTDLHNYRFEYMLYDGYGVEDQPESIALSLKAEPSVYRGKIEGYDFPEGTFLILTDRDNSTPDTLQPRENGSFTLRDLDPSKTYRITSPDRDFHANNMLRVYDKDNSMMAERPYDNPRYFEFGIIDKDIVAVKTEGKEDESVLKFSLWGQIREVEKFEKPMRLRLFDADNVFLAESYAVKDNNFAFTNIPPGDKFRLETEIEQSKARIIAYRSSANDSAKARIETDKSFLLDFSGKKPTQTLAMLSNAKTVNVAPGSQFELPEVYYNFNSYYLNVASRKSLDPLVDFLKKNGTLKIEIHAHTDAQGPEGYNKTLSQRRAESVVDYLISNGIQKERMSARGFGESELTNKCADGVPCTDDEHAKNRRTAFAIVSN